MQSEKPTVELVLWVKHVPAFKKHLKNGISNATPINPHDYSSVSKSSPRNTESKLKGRTNAKELEKKEKSGSYLCPVSAPSFVSTGQKRQVGVWGPNTLD